MALTPLTLTEAGKVTTGYSKPYVALYSASGSTVTYSGGRRLARGVEVNLDVQSADNNNFYADNVVAESAAGVFTAGSINIGVDGLLIAAEKMIMGLPAASTINVGTDTANVYKYGDEQAIPYCGYGHIVRFMCGGATGYTPHVFTKVKFNTVANAAKTQEEEIDWQTQALSAVLHRDDTTGHNWHIVGEDYATEAEAESVLKALLGITEPDPDPDPDPDPEET